MKNVSIKTIVAIGIGSAIFFVLAKFASVPTPLPNTTIQISYAVLALLAVIFGPVAGAFIGLIGHALNDAVSYGSVWWSWVVVSTFVGFIIGLAGKRINIESGIFGKKEIVIFNVVQFIAQAIGWAVIAPVLDILIYAEPVNKVFTQGLWIGTSNIVTVGVLGTILLTAYAKTRNKNNTLQREL